MNKLIGKFFEILTRNSPIKINHQNFWSKIFSNTQDIRSKSKIRFWNMSNFDIKISKFLVGNKSIGKLIDITVFGLTPILITQKIFSQTGIFRIFQHFVNFREFFTFWTKTPIFKNFIFQNLSKIAKICENFQIFGVKNFAKIFKNIFQIHRI